MGKKGEFRKHKRSIKRIQEKDECRSEEARKDKEGGRKRFKEGGFTRKIYNKNVIWMGQWKVREGVLEKIRKELVKMEVSFSRGETLKGGNVKIAESRLNFLLFSYSYFYFHLIYFHIYF